MLDRADEVVFLTGGRVAAVGHHRELLRDLPAYRALVLREDEVRT
jgi:ABC-type multidrug transport system fused ATPase/permease subunit